MYGHGPARLPETCGCLRYFPDRPRLESATCPGEDAVSSAERWETTLDLILLQSFVFSGHPTLQPRSPSEAPDALLASPL